MHRRSFCRLLAAAPIACLPALAAARQAQSEGEPEGELIDIALEISDGGRPLFAPQLQARSGRKLSFKKEAGDRVERLDLVAECDAARPGRVRLQGELSFREIDSLDWRARGRFEMDLQMNQPATTAVRDAQAGRALQIKATVRPGKPPA